MTRRFALLAIAAFALCVPPAAAQYPNLDLDLPKNAVSARASLVTVIPA
jgi:hypothetical protein